MSKLTKFLFAFSAFALMLPNQPAKAAETSEKSVISASTVYEERKGRTVTLDIYISGKDKIAGGSLEIDYNESALTVSKVDAGDQLQGYLSSVNSEEDGTVSLTWAKAEGEVQKGTLLTVTARLTNGNEAIALDLNNVQLFKEDGSLMETDVFDGAVKPFDGKKQTHDKKVAGDRDWKITLNKDFNPATVNTKTVKILDSRGTEVEIVVNVTGQRVFTVKPKTTLARGTYTLLITEQVHSRDGKPLKEPIQFEYTVE